MSILKLHKPTMQRHSFKYETNSHVQPVLNIASVVPKYHQIILGDLIRKLCQQE